MRDSRFVGGKSKTRLRVSRHLWIQAPQVPSFRRFCCSYRFVYLRTMCAGSVICLSEYGSTRSQRHLFAYLRWLRPNQDDLDDTLCYNWFAHTRRKCENSMVQLGWLCKMDAVINLSRGCIISSQDYLSSRKVLTIHTFLCENRVTISIQLQRHRERSTETWSTSYAHSQSDSCRQILCVYGLWCKQTRQSLFTVW